MASSKPKSDHPLAGKEFPPIPPKGQRDGRFTGVGGCGSAGTCDDSDGSAPFSCGVSFIDPETGLIRASQRWDVVLKRWITLTPYDREVAAIANLQLRSNLMGERRKAEARAEIERRTARLYAFDGAGFADTAQFGSRDGSGAGSGGHALTSAADSRPASPAAGVHYHPDL